MISDILITDINFKMVMRSWPLKTITNLKVVKLYLHEQVEPHFNSNDNESTRNITYSLQHVHQA